METPLVPSRPSSDMGMLDGVVGEEPPHDWMVRKIVRITSEYTICLMEFPPLWDIRVLDFLYAVKAIHYT